MFNLFHLGCVEYINALPLVYALKFGKVKSEFSFVFDIPTNLNALLKNKRIMGAMTSSSEFLDGDYTMLPGYCIAATDKILSVNLYHKKPLKDCSIAISHHSSTSLSLLKVLLRHYWNFETKIITLDRKVSFFSYDAFLLIGDEALQNLSFPGYQTIDLAEVWNQMTKLPFVFAVFSALKESDSRLLKTFENELEKSLCFAEKNLQEIIDFANKKTGVKKNILMNYYSCCSYRMDERKLQGLKKFETLRKHE